MYRKSETLLPAVEDHRQNLQGGGMDWVANAHPLQCVAKHS